MRRFIDIIQMVVMYLCIGVIIVSYSLTDVIYYMVDYIKKINYNKL